MAEILFGEIEESLWTTNEPDLEGYLGEKNYSSAEDIEKNGKTALISNRPGRLEAEIIEPGELLPYSVKLVRRDDVWFWDCDCACSWPCAHLGALILGINRNDSLKIFSRKNIPKISRLEDTGELFTKVEEVRKTLNTEAATVKTLVLPAVNQNFLNLEMNGDCSKKRKDEKDPEGVLVFSMQDGSDGVIRISPAVLRMKPNGKPGKLEELFSRELLSGAISPEEELLLEKVRSSYSKEIPLLSEIFTFLSGLARLYLEKERVFYHFYPCDQLKADFRFSGILKNKDIEFKPAFLPIPAIPGQAGSEKGYGLTNIHISGDTIFCLATGTPEIRFLKTDSNTRFIIAMMKQSYRKLSSTEINRLKALTVERHPENLQFDFNLEKAQVQTHPPETILKIVHGSQECRLSFWFRYGVQEIHHSSSLHHLFGGTNDNQKVLFLQQRNQDFEGLIMDAVRSRFKENMAAETGPYNRFFQKDDHDITLTLGITDFFKLHAPFLMEKEIEIRINDKTLVRSSSLSFNVKKKQDWFDIRLEFPGVDGDILLAEELMSSNVVQKGTSYIILTTEDIHKLIKLQKMGMDTKGFLKAATDNLGVVDLIYEQTLEKENLLEQKKDIIDKLKQFSDKSEPLPNGLKAVLRDYQQEGFQRLSFWHRYHLNGCLADDMGLGKTIQTLALLQRLKETGRFKVSLLLAPVVTLPNWEAEAARFSPDLKVFRHSGNNRLKSPDELEGKDVIIVSYNTLRNDIQFFSSCEFYYIILDEAHYVKNAASQTFKAIRSLKSRHRLSLTGTPLENNTLELWTQMNFLNPWLLGSMKDFKNIYARPIEKMGDAGAADTLRALISPFIIRRRKDEVLDELPPKEEILVYSEMGLEQEEEYNRMKAALRQRVLDLLEQSEGKKSTVEILTFMLKLRQMAILPGLIDKKYADIPSCKMDTLFLLLEEALLENHKVLIFSQFTSVIDHLEKHLRVNRLKFVTLTGATKDRAEPVNQFQDDPETRIFLLSLKAGGVGINLTAADYVILFDPWWNPAAEAQAVDRAHRMGQKRKVFTYRIIARNTIEEKIMALQQQKKELTDALISDSSGAFSSMGKDDILNLFQ